ncbi:MAG: L-2-amino-thiazoline-4-carboxylic acid hydrolase, partial [Myxococcota bacterium]|nr:L-2-amino-thiazoline-4-carboxylic acid hydrolase [Myxococcota bacterium]
LVIATVGAKFVRSNADFELADWADASPKERETFAKNAMRRFPNVTQPTVTVGEETMDVRFSYCRLAQGAHELGRSDLASLFCSADAAFYNGTSSRPSLTRPHTIAEGASECHFQFRWPAAKDNDTTE